MKVNDYVRTKYGISKILSNPEAHNFNIDIFKKDRITLRCIRKKDVIKSSPNIIDLIEEHDILKIEEQKGIYTICEVEEFRDPYVNYKFLGVRLENQSRARRLDELNIKSIVTKEQFKSMGYEVNNK